MHHPRYHPGIKPQKGIRELVAELQTLTPPASHRGDPASHVIKMAQPVVDQAKMDRPGHRLPDGPPGPLHPTREAIEAMKKAYDPKNADTTNNNEGNATTGFSGGSWDVILNNLKGGNPVNPAFALGDPYADKSKWPNGGYDIPSASSVQLFADWFTSIFGGAPEGVGRIKPFGPRPGAENKAADAVTGSFWGRWQKLIQEIKDAGEAATKQAAQISPASVPVDTPAAGVIAPKPLAEQVKEYAKSEHVHQLAKARLSGYEAAEAEYAKRQQRLDKRRFDDLFGHTHWANQYGSGDRETSGISPVDLHPILAKAYATAEHTHRAHTGRIESMIDDLLKAIRQDMSEQINSHLANMHRLAALGY